MISSPPEFVLRPARPDDAEAVLQIVPPESGFGLDDIRNEWRRTDLERDTWAWEHDGRLLAFGILRSRGEELSVNGFVHPDFRGRGLGTAILQATEARACERGGRKLDNGILAADRAAAALLEANGYRDVAHYYVMTIELEEPPPEPEWPEGLEPRPFEREHAHAFWAADDEAFQDEEGYESEPFEEFVERRLESPRFDPELWTAVWDGDEIAATLIADWKRFGAGWIAGLGVRRPWRRRGVGRALLLRAFGQFYERGERRVSLNVHTENPTGATRLYESVGMRVEREDILYRKELVVVREPGAGDAEGIAEACNELSTQLYGVADLSAEEIRHWLSLPNLETAVAELGGEICGYTDFRRRDDAPIEVDLRVRPSAWGRGLADALLDPAEAAAGPETTVRCFVAERDDESRGALERRGYRLIRHSFKMQIDFAEPPEPPEWPPGFAVRCYAGEEDTRAVYDCHQESFADHWEFRPEPFGSWRRFSVERPDFDPSLWWLAEADGELAGISLNHWHASGDRSFGWIGVLSVRKPWRGRGLGLALLRHSFCDFAARGATRVGLDVDAENTTGAVRLYERAGMRPVRRLDIYEKTP
jgi:mycothiol synthase